MEAAARSSVWRRRTASFADGSNKMVTTPIIGSAIEEDHSINENKELNWESVDYSQFYNLDRLGEEMDSFFGEEVVEPAA